MRLLQLVDIAAALWWGLGTLLWWWTRRGLSPLRAATHDDGETPRVSVIIAARNEQTRIAETVTRFLAQRDVDLELIVVDDRSTDATPSILEGLAREHPRLRVLRIETLPEGWLGKPHACHRGAEAATGDWLLFSDADAWPREEAVAAAVEEARRESAEHFCLVPDEARSTLWGRAAWITFYLCALPTIWIVNGDRFPLPVGIGAFNLVRADAYRKIGGHTKLRMEVIDDAGLGWLLQRAGFRTRCRAGHGWLEVDWAGGLLDVVGALRKNLFAAFGYRLSLALPAALIPLTMWLAAVTGPLHGSPEGWVAFVALLATTIPSAWVARRIDAGWREAGLACLAMPTLALALLVSAGSAVRRRGVIWRGTFYSLRSLRRARRQIPSG